MKPPICQVCGHDSEPELRRSGRGGDWVEFADHEPLPRGMPGHPHGLEWFCTVHLDAARALAGWPVDEALRRLGERFGAEKR